MNVITLKDPKIMGDKHPTYGYSVWSETDGDYPVMFNVMDETNLLPDVRVTYEVAELKNSSKGTDYLRLKKVKFEDSPVKKEERIPFTEKPAPTFSKSDNKFLKDLSDTHIRLYNGSLNYAKDAGLNLISDSDDRRAYLEYVKDITDELLRWADNIRSGTHGTAVSTPSPEKSFKEDNPRTAAGPLRSAWEERKDLPKTGGKAMSWDEPEYTDADMP